MSILSHNKKIKVIDLLPGQYLSDVIQSITDASETKPYTINFYNHSKTINWDTFTEIIHVPEYVNINFVGNINWWNKVYYPGIHFAGGLLATNPTDKLFVGFSFGRAQDYIIKVSGLPTNLQKIFFGGLDQSYQIANDYQDLIDAPDDWGEAEFGLVRVNGSKYDDVRNDALYKKIGNNFIDVTPNFQNVDFIGNSLQLSYFYAANCQLTCFNSANCQSAYFNYANCQLANFGAANCQSADFAYANCQSASFYYANCQGAYFAYANCESASFYYANCQGANFAYANCQSVNFAYANCQGAYFAYANYQGANFNSANCQSANFAYANLKNVSWYNIVSIVGANFRNADLTGGINLPDRINTKAKWIAECGAGNVNAGTIWIDGTSILD